MRPQKQLSRWTINFQVMTQCGMRQFQQGVAATQQIGLLYRVANPMGQGVLGQLGGITMFVHRPNLESCF